MRKLNRNNYHSSAAKRCLLIPLAFTARTLGVSKAGMLYIRVARVIYKQMYLDFISTQVASQLIRWQNRRVPRCSVTVTVRKLMPAYDLFHTACKLALENDQWTITDDPLYLRFGEDSLYIDLAAEKVIGAEKAGARLQLR